MEKQGHLNKKQPREQQPREEATTTTVEKVANGPPPIHFSFRWRSIILYILFLLVLNLLLPCLIFYLVRIYAEKIDLRTNIGISSASLGVSSCFDAPFRLYKRRFKRPLMCGLYFNYGPLKDDTWWHLDFFMWSYTMALFSFAFPLAIAPAVNPVAINFFLMSTAMLVGPFGVIFLITLFRFRLPFWCSSDPPGTIVKPAVFYMTEDLCAVDFRHGREYRKSLSKRWDASPPFQQLMKYLTIYWVVACTVYFGITAAVTWVAPLNFAFAWVLGQFFVWGLVAAVGCRILTKWGLKREKRWFENVSVEERAIRP